MKQLIESLKRLYKANQVSEEVILNMHKNGKITDDEKDYILNK